jgi:hypothetical protein
MLRVVGLAETLDDIVRTWSILGSSPSIGIFLILDMFYTHKHSIKTVQ